MKTFLFGLALCLFVPVTAIAGGSPGVQPSIAMTVDTGSTASSCGSIGDADERYFCEAKAKGDKNTCSSIRDDDKRKYCTAVVSKNKNECSSVRDNDMRKRCEAEAN